MYKQSPVIAAEHKQCCLSLKYLLKVGRIDTVICLEEKECCELEQRCSRDQSALLCAWHCCLCSYVCCKSVTRPTTRKELLKRTAERYCSSSTLPNGVWDRQWMVLPDLCSSGFHISITLTVKPIGFVHKFPAK